jgi:hypothetical protein
MSHESKFKTDRRTFIAASTVAVAGLAAPNAFAAEAVAEAPMVAVGYFGGVAAVARRSNARQSLIAAETLTTSDPSLVRTGARVSVRGLWQRPESRARRGSYAIEVNYAVAGAAERLPFYAWMQATTVHGSTGASPASFIAPVDATGTVELNVRRDGGTDRAAKLSFSVTSRAGAYMLDRGTYVIAFLEAGDPIPDWRSMELVPEATSMEFDRDAGLIRMRTITGSTPPSFDYIVVTFGSNVEDEPKREAAPVEEPQTVS